MKQILTLISAFLTFNLSFSQTAEELNQQSKELLTNNEIEKAIPILKKASELGSGEAQYNLGYFLQNGIGIEKNVSEAIKWYKKSSDNNFNDGHYAMMMAYGNGEGIEQNSELAFTYALKCADNNDPTCMWNVVECYATGKGVGKNDEKFKEWILKLAKLESPENLIQSGYITSARLALANYYKKGEIFNKDFYQSYLWLIIYNESKRDFSVLKQQEIISEIKEIEKSLTKNQIENGEIKAERILGRKLTNYRQLYSVDY